MFFGKEGSDLQVFFRWAFYIFTFLFPLIRYEGYLFNGTSTRAVNTVLFIELLALVFGFALFSKRRRLSFAVSPITISLMVLLFVLSVSSLLGVDLATSFWSKATRTTGLFYFFHLGFLYLFFWFAFSEQNALRNFIKVFIISAGFFSLLSLLGQEGVGWFFAEKAWSGLTIGNSTFAGMYLYSAFMLSIYFLYTHAGRSKWWWYLLPAVFIISPYIINFGVWRGEVNILAQPAAIIGSAQASALTLFASMVALIGFWIASKIKKADTRRMLLLAVIGIGAILFAVGVRSLLTEGGRVQQFYLTQASAVRPIVWQSSGEAIKERPLLGWGVDNFDWVFQRNYNNRILEEKNGGEAWLDRAHNIFIDQTIETGYVGIVVYMIVYLILIGSLIYVIFYSKERSDSVLAVALLVYFVGHLAELQTAFDTTITYFALTCFAAMTGILFAKTRAARVKKESTVVSPWPVQVTAAGVMVMFALGMFSIGTIPIMKVEKANGAIRRVGSSEKRIPLYETLLSSPIDNGEFLWTTSNDIQRGISLDPKMIEDPKQREGIKKELDVIVSAYERYLEESPNDYRAILNLADIYIYQRLFEVDNLEKAHRVLDEAVALVPQSPQAYWMKSVAYLYQAKFSLAKEWAQKAYDINPGIEESARLVEYINKSVPSFPVITLYSFRKI